VEPLRIGTRGSKLALYQSNRVADMLRERLGRECELVILKTRGDVDRSKPVADLGVVGAFTKELERALLEGEVDLAVHSLKDLPTTLPPGLCVAAQPERALVHDVLLIHPDAHDPDAPGVPLREGSTLGTASLRRQAQLAAVRPDLKPQAIRGNVPTRVGMAKDRTVDAVVLAAAGVTRLELDLAPLHVHALPTERFLPAPAQGALGIEVRESDTELRAALEAIHDGGVARATAAERELLHGLGVGCSVPLGALATVSPDGAVDLRAALGPARFAPGSRPALRQVRVRAAEPDSAAALALRAIGDVSLEAPAALAGKRVLVARDPARAASLCAAITEVGGEASARPAMAVEPCGDAAAARAALDALPADGWLLFTSAVAVERFLAVVGEVELGGRKVGAVGPATARALATAGLPVDLLPETASGAGLATAFQAAGGTRALWPCAADARRELSDALGDAVVELPLYRSHAARPLSEAEQQVDAIVCASPKAAQALLADGVHDGARWIAIGPTTAAELETLGITAHTASSPTDAGLLEALGEALG